MDEKSDKSNANYIKMRFAFDFSNGKTVIYHSSLLFLPKEFNHELKILVRNAVINTGEWLVFSFLFLATEVMYREGGLAYVYLCYGMHNLLNIVTGPENSPQAVLIRGVEGFSGPGRLTKAMGIDRSMNGVSFVASDLMWLEDDGVRPVLDATPRIGISYASPEDQQRLWRFVVCG